MEKKKQKFIILFFVMVLLFFGLSIIGSIAHRMNITQSVIDSKRATFILQFFMYCAAGMVLGIENFYTEWKKSGHWRVNTSKLLIIGIPSFIISILFILYYIIYWLPIIIVNILSSYSLIVTFMQILLGYTIMTSFYKSEETTPADKEP